MLSSDVITHISNFCAHDDLSLLNKEIYNKIYLSNSFEDWYEIYCRYFMGEKIVIPKLEYSNTSFCNEIFSLHGNMNWKKEYLRVKSYHVEWDIFFNFDRINLYYLYLFNKQIKQIPKEIGGLINLVELQLSHNKIKYIPKEIGKLINLQELWVDYNQIKQIPKEIIGGLINLIELHLSHNKIKYIPKEIGKLINLHELWVDYNQISKIPEEIGNLINLQKLFLNNNQIEEMPKEISNLIKLKFLWLHNNKIYDFPEKLKKVPNLNELICKYENDSNFSKLIAITGTIIISLFLIFKFTKN